MAQTYETQVTPPPLALLLQDQAVVFDQAEPSPREPAPVLVQDQSSPEDPSEAQPHSDQAFSALINDIFGSYDAKGGED